MITIFIVFLVVFCSKLGIIIYSSYLKKFALIYLSMGAFIFFDIAHQQFVVWTR